MMLAIFCIKDRIARTESQETGDKSRHLVPNKWRLSYALITSCHSNVIRFPGGVCQVYKTGGVDARLFLQL